MNFTLTDPHLSTAKVQLVPSPLFRKLDFTICSPEDINQLVGDQLRQSDREYLLVVYLTSRNKVIDIEIVAMGTLEAMLISPREVFKGAILANAAAIILVHNHPSGNCQPSFHDKQITAQLVAAGKICGIPVWDHVIVGDGWFSFLENGILNKPDSVSFLGSQNSENSEKESKRIKVKKN